MAQNKREEAYDVAIVGAGPAGLVIAAWMSVAGVKTLVLDRNSAPPKNGHADGLDRRSFEILDMFNLGQTIWQEAHETIEVSYWSGVSGTITRKFTRPNSASGPPCFSSYSEATLRQGRIEQHLLNFIKEQGSVDIRRCHEPNNLEILPSDDCRTGSYPIRVGVSDRSSEPSLTVTQETCNPTHKSVRCRYLVGCDGAHSWVRKQCGLRLEGEHTDHHWGVIDCVPITNFPDIRKRCIIKSASGNTMLIPRERNLVRFYVQLSPSLKTKSLQDQRKAILSKIEEILKPYLFSAKIVEWTSLYSVGQRICNTYFIRERIFLAGDAVHTHSPKAGMGMNTSMQDAFNLGWKLASVIKGCHAPEILQTYQEERLPIAQRLLSFDKEIYGVVAEKFGKTRSETLVGTLHKENTSASGSAVRYHANMLVNHTSTSWKAPQLLTPGSRLPDLQIMNHSDSCMWRLHEILNKSGNWALLVFGGDISTKSQMGKVSALAAKLSRSCSIMERVNHRFRLQKIGGIEAHLIHSAPRHGIDLHSLPCLFVTQSETLGYDYGKVFVDNVSYTGIGGTVYRNLDIPTWGCIVLVRPDHHIAFCGGLDGISELEAFIMRTWTVDG